MGFAGSGYEAEVHQHSKFIEFNHWLYTAILANGLRNLHCIVHKTQSTFRKCMILYYVAMRAILPTSTTFYMYSIV